MPKKHTYDLGVTGNCAYMSYIDDKAHVQWMCWPRFDSSFIFGGLLDKKKGGQFSISPDAAKYKTHQYYIENTNVLCTDFECDSGKFRVTDFAPRFYQYERIYKPLMFIRKIEPLADTPSIRVCCNPVGNYGKKQPDISQGSSHIRYMGLGKQVRLSTNISLHKIMEEDAFVLNEPKYLIMTYDIPLEGPIESTAEDFLRKTVLYWRDWVKSTSIGSFHQKQIVRSALILKIQQFEDTGAIVAAGTTSLPEHPGSGRNWDYRYCWLRDAYYTLTAFNNIGHFEELERYFHYIENATISEDGRFQPLYTILGKKEIKEKTVELSGYQGNNQPVRIGNQAHTHNQNDVYGQVIVTLLPLYADSRFISSERIKSDRLIMHALKMIEKTLDEPDAGLWEFRNKTQQHCYTFLFHWAGSCAALKIARQLKDEKMAALALKLKKEAEKKINACYVKKEGYYAQAIETKNMDASCLQLITMNYLDPKSKAAGQHLKKLESTLKTKEGLFYRYKHNDDFGDVKSTFLICAFWYVEAMACIGRLDEAIELFEKLSKYSNRLGLLSEDIDATTGSQWGNFPQAYSHVGQVNAAYRIAKKLDLPNFL
ncbi:MAG: glycosyl hydrolase [Flavobacteriales bacterium]|nr:glycoside hydrolase family 15 protein [Bacteroidales bacterium AH-315-I05]PCJ85619.1 MAG: glycosyl hydrolase [Flavobacteriales bacterium]